MLSDMEVSINWGTPKSSNLMGFSRIKHLLGGTPIHGKSHMGQLCKRKLDTMPQGKSQGWWSCFAVGDDSPLSLFCCVWPSSLRLTMPPRTEGVSPISQFHTVSSSPFFRVTTIIRRLQWICKKPVSLNHWGSCDFHKRSTLKDQSMTAGEKPNTARDPRIRCDSAGFSAHGQQFRVNSSMFGQFHMSYCCFDPSNYIPIILPIHSGRLCLRFGWSLPIGCWNP